MSPLLPITSLLALAPFLLWQMNDAPLLPNAATSSSPHASGGGGGSGGSGAIAVAEAPLLHASDRKELDPPAPLQQSRPSLSAPTPGAPFHSVRIVHDEEEEREAIRLDRAAGGRALSLPSTGASVVIAATASGVEFETSRNSAPSASLTGSVTGSASGVAASAVGGLASGGADDGRGRAKSSFELEMESNSASGRMRRLPKKTLAVAIFLLVTGIVCLSIGLARLVSGEDGSVPLLVIGGIAFLPGAYQCFAIYKAWRGYGRHRSHSRSPLALALVLGTASAARARAEVLCRSVPV
jgi:hypothetical protein